MKTILPETRQVALVYGGSPLEIARWQGFADKVRKGGLEPVELRGLSMDDTRAAVSRLPADTIVIILAPTVDAQGHVLPPSQNCELITSAANIPTFTLGMQDFGCGVVGGLMRDWSITGRRFGRMALERLTNPSVEVVNLPATEFTRLAFDERQLVRWGIPERRLPPGATVQFRQPNLWRDYRGLVIAALGLTLVQSLLIGGLVFEHRRRRRAETESRRNLAAIAHLDRRAAMGELATSLAHELNQPLNAILQNAGVAQMILKANPLPPAFGEMPDIINDIRKDDLRASEVIRRMRGLLQKRELESHPVDLNEVVQETVAIVRPDARARGVQLEMDLLGGMRPVPGDRIHLQQVLLNLLINALDAVSKAPPESRRVLVWTEHPEGLVRVSVTDTGCGIPIDRAAKIFEPFYTTKSEGSRMGMGLTIARSIVEAHSGRMAAENNTGDGATVSFEVPVFPNDPREPA
jgi:signal transduction histidine kinase